MSTDEPALPPAASDPDRKDDGLDLAKSAARAAAASPGTPARKKAGPRRRTFTRSSGARPDNRDPQLLDAIAVKRKDELDRGISLVGPHRDELLLTLGDGDLRLPVKGYASHGESWSFALALRLASYDLLRADGDDPILVLDDVFAELDTERRSQLAELVAGAEQVLVTAAVAADVPASLQGMRYLVADGEVTRDD